MRLLLQPRFDIIILFDAICSNKSASFNAKPERAPASSVSAVRKARDGIRIWPIGKAMNHDLRFGKRAVVSFRHHQTFTGAVESDRLWSTAAK